MHPQLAIVRSIILAANATARRRWGKGQDCHKVNKVVFSDRLTRCLGKCRKTYSSRSVERHTATITIKLGHAMTHTDRLWATVAHELAHCIVWEHGPAFRIVDAAMRDIVAGELLKRGIDGAPSYGDAHPQGYRVPKAKGRARRQPPTGWRVAGTRGDWEPQVLVNGFWQGIGVSCPTRGEAIDDAEHYSQQQNKQALADLVVA